MDEEGAALASKGEAELAAMLIAQLQSAPDPLQELTATLGISRDCTTRELAEVLALHRGASNLWPPLAGLGPRRAAPRAVCASLCCTP